MNTLSNVVGEHARSKPSSVAFIEAATDETLTWGDYNNRADRFAQYAHRYDRGDRLALQFERGIDMHIAMLGCERAGVVGVGIGPRAGKNEVEHLMDTTGARALLTAMPELPAVASVATPVDGSADDSGVHVGATTHTRDTKSRAFNDEELWLLNSTSGTTGLPKCVMHHQRRWFAFHALAAAAGAFTEDDVFMSLLPSPFGFGLWTSHFTPTILGAPCIILDRFAAAAATEAIERHHVSVIAAVSTQFVMMLNDTAFETTDFSSLRALFTGGEMVPPTRAREWETRTDSRVLQFYGSNETGALSNTTFDDDEVVRLHTAGHVIPSLQVRLFDAETSADITASGGPGIAACKGDINCLGYFNDDPANRELFTDDGWMRTGDLCTIDADGVLTVAGRASDFIIRGGKNISAAVVEQHCATMPGVALAAAVAKPDAVFGERVCIFCVVNDRAASFTLPALLAHLGAQGVGKEYWPEYLVISHDDLARSSGGKVAKATLRTQAAALKNIS